MQGSASLLHPLTRQSPEPRGHRWHTGGYSQEVMEMRSTGVGEETPEMVGEVPRGREALAGQGGWEPSGQSRAGSDSCRVGSRVASAVGVGVSRLVSL